jgi:signal transduction histidine kinase
MEDWLAQFALANFARSADTAHDLKTPLNVAVLNLELLRMRMRKLAGDDDEKLAGYARAIEIELRRMARIFDTFFLLSIPPKNEEPAVIDLAAVCAEVGSAEGYEVAGGDSFPILAHEARIRQAFKMFFDGAASVLRAEERRIEVSRSGDFAVIATGTAVASDFDLSKIFKFYYTDPNGNPDLSLAAARLIAETYGGEVTVSDGDKVAIRMTFPGDR